MTMGGGVLPEFQGQGFGSRIMDELEKEIFAEFDDSVREVSLPVSSMKTEDIKPLITSKRTSERGNA